jgi:DHA1 family bicyclomycin/chloramphenicol resistance-like MFS transporter
MKLDPTSLAMTCLLASMTAIGPLTTDTFVASLPQISRAFEATTASVQATITCYLIGFATGQVFYGPLSDKLGRRPLVLAGLALYVAASIACMFATSILMLVVARVVQALGAAGPIILSRAIVRDSHEGAQASRQFAIMSMIMGITPIAMPIIGGFMQARFGWQASFVVMASVAATVLAFAVVLLPETNARRSEGALSLKGILGSFAIVARNRAYLSILFIQMCSYNGLFGFVSSASVVLQVTYGLTPIEFGWLFALCSSSYVFGAWLGTKLIAERGVEGMIGLGCLWLCIGGVCQMLGVFLFPTSVAAIIFPDMLFFMGVGFLLPNTLAAAMTPFPERAGAASSFMGFAQMTSGAIVGTVVGATLGSSAWPLAIVTGVAGVCALVIFHATAHLRVGVLTKSGNLGR